MSELSLAVAGPEYRPDQSLSQNLRAIIAAPPPPGGLTLNTLFVWTGGRGFFLFIVLLCLPFLLPASIPGLSTPLGMVVVVLALRLAFGRPLQLPAWMGEKPLPPRFRQALAGGARVLGAIERLLVRPRHTAWMRWRSVRCVNGLMMAFMGFYLALPLAIPFTNFLPAYGVLLLALSMMEDDGVLIWVGHAVSVSAVVYLVLVADKAVELTLKYYEPVLHWLRGWL